MDSPLSLPTQETSASSTLWRVVCLCAEWCGVCRDYQRAFEMLAEDHPGVQFQWVDVEDDEAFVGDVDVETFPTLLIAQGQQARFFGPLLPQSGVLDRLLRSLAEQGLRDDIGDPVAQTLLARMIEASQS